MGKWIYKILRSLIFAVTLVVVGLYVVAYVLISIPAFNNYLKNFASRELTALFGGEVEIANLHLSPFNEAVVEGLRVYDPEGEECIEIERLGAGISIWKLLYERRIELTYGEIIGIKAHIIQREKGEPFNIQFIIDALQSKDDTKEKTHFNLALKNVVVRKGRVFFCREWARNEKKIGKLDPAVIEIDNFCADLTLPKISDTGVEFDLRRLSFNMPGIAEIEKIGFRGEAGSDGFGVRDLEVEWGDSRINIPEIELKHNDTESLEEALSKNTHTIEITESYITPSDLSFLFPPLEALKEQFPLEIKVTGNLNSLKLNQFIFGSPSSFYLTISALLTGLNINKPEIEVSSLDLKAAAPLIEKFVNATEIPSNLKGIIRRAGDIGLKAAFNSSMFEPTIKGYLELISGVADVFVEGSCDVGNMKELIVEGEADITQLHLKDLLPSVPVNNVKAVLTAKGSIKKGIPSGSMNLFVDNFVYKDQGYTGFTLDFDKNEEDLKGSFFMDNQIGEIETDFSGRISDEIKEGKLQCRVKNLNLSDIVDMKKYKDYVVGVSLDVEAKGNDLYDLEGYLHLNNLSFSTPDKSNSLRLKYLNLSCEKSDSIRNISLASDWVDANLEGEINFKKIAPQINNLIAEIFPSLVNSKEVKDTELSNIELQATIKANNSLPQFFNLPFRLLVPVSIEGNLSSTLNNANLSIDIPYLQQGKDKLIYDSRLYVDLDGRSGDMDLIVETTMPVKRGDLQLKIDVTGESNHLSTNLDWINTENKDFNGRIALEGDINRSPLTRVPEFKIDFLRSYLSMGDADWILNPASIFIEDKFIRVENLKLWHDDQFVEINGVASPNYEDVLQISLAEIDVDYIFDMLSINYVTFGGTATGEIEGHALLSSDPVGETESLFIKDFSYNGCLLGNCRASSRWNNIEKEVEIRAEIEDKGELKVTADGGIWIGRDSLSFSILADKVPVEFVQPFMAAFSSHVGGFATGDIKLFGTFKDIDMTGRIYADSVAVKLDYTNTIYHGSDSIILNPGRIEIPSFTLYDKNGKSAILSGTLTHRYFHDPSFTFRLSEAEDFLCYDTNSDINPDWYGVLLGTGTALLRGVPGLTDITADMRISGNSSFTFVLNDQQSARDYQFLTFTDRRAEMKQALENKPVDFKELFKKRTQEENNPSRFGIDIRASVTPAVLFTLVMDPVAGDKITARGSGAMQVKYESDNDEMQMYGKYEISEGNYNFSLQDIILRDFKIKEGSYISFNGNPLQADLGISAAYRVNTNLSDLDKSFASDRDLTRTNVPVDAILSVNGNMTHPDITFDIELPTLSQDVERKVKSIISTDDMMNRQIIYLLALNRFYTPEYMGSSSNGGELAAAVASSTISSQLSNILGQLTDKVSVSPSFRSDKGDFSDIEVDVALSSRLLNNRLLINGNFGYRDRSNSSTTFVGDFDVEYLLSKNGNLRLKAYNHFNDQNYYLREALTTQGLGIVFRKDFDD